MIPEKYLRLMFAASVGIQIGAIGAYYTVGGNPIWAMIVSLTLVIPVIHWMMKRLSTHPNEAL